MTSGVRDLGIKRRQRRVRALAIALIALGVAAVAGLILWLVFFSTVFAVKKVEVAGASLLSAQQVQQAAQVPLNTPLVRLDRTEIAGRVVKLPAVKSASVATTWPNSVRIEVVERKAVFQREVSGGFQFVDAEGMIFHAQNKRDPKLSLVKSADEDQAVLRDAATVLAAVGPVVAKRLQLVVVRDRSHITLKLDQGAVLEWGSSDQSELKSKVCEVLLKTKARVYDVSAPSNPVTRGP